MFRPAIHKSTWECHTIDLETCPNIDDYIIVWIANESIENNKSQDINGNIIKQEAPTRETALKQEAEYEAKLIDEAVKKNKSSKK